MFPFSNPDPKSVEARAEIREAAHGLREIFSAYVQEGFSEDQALELVGRMLEASVIARGE